ncbi:hypothetical protein ACFVZD_47410 [Streptomyces sp. NPDC058287]|uniref:hypothetical protein n=1 Tax=unclassified Streptomyces TaxID=2593676 RepID=UPI0036E9515E
MSRPSPYPPEVKPAREPNLAATKRTRRPKAAALAAYGEAKPNASRKRTPATF